MSLDFPKILVLSIQDLHPDFDICSLNPGIPPTQCLPGLMSDLISLLVLTLDIFGITVPPNLPPIKKFHKGKLAIPINLCIFSHLRRDGRAVECTGLENQHRLVAYPGFESLSLRHI